MTFHIDPGDPPTQWEAAEELRDDRSQLEKLIDLNAWFSLAGGQYSVTVGYPSRQSFLVGTIEVARACVAILNLSDPAEVELIITALVRAHSEKCVVLENYRPEFDDDGYEPDWSDEYPDDPF